MTHTLTRRPTISSGGSWSIASNWAPPKVPQPPDYVLITGTGTFNVSTDVTIGGLMIDSGHGDVSLSLSSGVFTVGPLINAAPIFVSGPSAQTALVATFLNQSLSVVLQDMDNGPLPISCFWTNVTPNMPSIDPVKIADPHGMTTKVSFNSPGTFVLRVSCSDGSESISSDIYVTAYGPASDWRSSAFSRSQVPYSSPYTCGNIPELALPVSSAPDAIGIDFVEYAAIRSHKMYDDSKWCATLGPCGSSHTGGIFFSNDGVGESFISTDPAFHWDAPNPDIPNDKRPSEYGLLMMCHICPACNNDLNTYPSFFAMDHYGIRVMPLYDGAALGTTFRIMGYKVALVGETFPKISAADFTMISDNEAELLLDITHPQYEARALALVQVAKHAPTVTDIGLVVYPREDIGVGDLGIWTFSSMNLKDDTTDDYAADSDTLVYGLETSPNSEPINNPPISGSQNFVSLQSVDFVGLKNVKGRTPVPNTNPYYSAMYWTRPDTLIDILSDKNQLAWDLTVFHTDYEGHDNVVLTGRNLFPLMSSNSIDNGYEFLARMRAERP